MQNVPRLSIALVLVASLVAASCSAVSSGRREQVTTRAEPLPSPSPKMRPRIDDFIATAYSVEGATASGGDSREGIVAADPDVLPLGSRIRVNGAGVYSGVYLVKDTGKRINGREIDIYLANDEEAKRFGKKRVKVEVLHRGSGAAEARRNPEPRPGTVVGVEAAR